MATHKNGADQASHLVQLLLPLQDNAGQPIPKARFEQVKKTLLECFGGLTSYAQTPASGLWKDDKDHNDAPVRDVLVVYEVMVEKLDADWWVAYRQELELAFGQEELVIRAQRIQRL